MKSKIQFSKKLSIKQRMPKTNSLDKSTSHIGPEFSILRAFTSRQEALDWLRKAEENGVHLRGILTQERWSTLKKRIHVHPRKVEVEGD